MKIGCPHCLVPFESAEESSLADMVCPSCGGNFRLSGVDTTRSFQPGVQVLGRFELLQQVGAGRFGSVWKARDTQLQRTVAVKIPRQGQLDPRETELFFRDARAAAQLKHPRIVSVHEVGRGHQTVYIVTDFIDGANLAEWLTGRRLSFRQAAELVIQVAEALHHAHEAGVVHRDVKPGNIMMDRNGQPYVIDFGLARREVGEMTVTVEGQVLGTPAYMPPEQARGEGHRADRRSDIYSLGAILFKLLTGELPFRGEARMLLLQILDEEPPSPRKLNADVPRDLETIALKCLEKEPAKRYQTARELADDLGRYLSGEPIKARPVGHIERAWRWCKRHAAVASLSASLLLLLVAVAVVAPVVAVHQSRLRRESELRRKQSESRRIDFQNQVAHNLFQRANEEHNAGRMAEGIALLAGAHALAVGSENPLGESIRSLMPGWDRESGRAIVEDEVVLAAAIGPDNHTAVIGGHNRQITARLWDTRTMTPFGEPLQHAASVRAVAISPDGRLVLTGSQDRTARLWDSRTGKAVGTPFQHSDEIWAVAFSPDGSTIITGGKDETARFWNTRSGEALGQPLQHADNVLVAAFSPDGQSVLTGSFDGTARMWDVQSKQPLKIVTQGKTPIYAVAFSPDGSTVLIGDLDTKARLWNAQTLEPIGEPLQHKGLVYAAAFSRDSRTLLTGSFDTTAQMWETRTGRAIGEPLRHAGWVMSVAFSPDGRLALTGSADGTARLWSIGDDIKLPHQDTVHAAVFSNDGRAALTGSADKTARLWDAHTGRSLGEPMMHDHEVRAAALSPDGRTALTGSSDHRVRLWDARTARSVAEPWRLDDAPRNINFCADGKTVLIEFEGQAVQLWDFQNGKPLSSPLRFEAAESLLENSPLLASSPAGDTVLIRGADESARLWNVPSGKARGKLLRHSAPIMDAAFSDDGRTVVTAGWDQAVRLWDAHTGTTIGRSFRHEGIVNAVTFGKGGRTILSGSSDRTARLWDIQKGMAVGQPLQHDSELSMVSLSPNERLALTICKDKTAYLWEVSSCTLLTRPLQRVIAIKDGIFNADGSAILFRCDDGSARLYEIPQPLPNDPQLIRAWAQARTGFELDNKSLLQRLSQAKWQKARQELETLERRR